MSKRRGRPPRHCSSASLRNLDAEARPVISPRWLEAAEDAGRRASLEVVRGSGFSGLQPAQPASKVEQGCECDFKDPGKPESSPEFQHAQSASHPSHLQRSTRGAAQEAAAEAPQLRPDLSLRELQRLPLAPLPKPVSQTLSPAFDPHLLLRRHGAKSRLEKLVPLPLLPAQLKMTKVMPMPSPSPDPEQELSPSAADLAALNEGNAVLDQSDDQSAANGAVAVARFDDARNPDLRTEPTDMVSVGSASNPTTELARFDSAKSLVIDEKGEATTHADHKNRRSSVGFSDFQDEYREVKHGGDGHSLATIHSHVESKASEFERVESGQSERFARAESSAPSNRSHTSGSRYTYGSYSYLSSCKSKRKNRKLQRAKSMAARGGPPWPDPKKYDETALFFLSLENPFRRAMIRVIEWKWTDRIVLGLIFLNTVQLALYNPLVTGGGVLAAVPDGHWASNMEATFVVTGQIFSALFTLECLIKIFGLGFFLGHHSYLADKSNYLDFFIVILGILDFIPSSGDDEGGGNLSALRALRVLRPLKAVTKFPELKFIVVLLLQCLPKLASVLQICLFIFFVFGILGVQLFKGVLRKRCFDVNNGENTQDLCGGMRTCYGYGTDTDDASFLTLRRTPSKYAGCLPLGENSGRGAINFDYIGGAVTTIFQTMTQEGWADIMYELSDTDHQLGGHVWVYFVILIVIGPWLAVNLFMVVISVQYDENMHLLQQAEKRLKEERLKLEHAVREQVLSCPFCHGASCEECDPEGIWHEINHSVHASAVGSSFGDGGLLRDTSTVTVGAVKFGGLGAWTYAGQQGWAPADDCKRFGVPDSQRKIYLGIVAAGRRIAAGAGLSSPTAMLSRHISLRYYARRMMREWGRTASSGIVAAKRDAGSLPRADADCTGMVVHGSNFGPAGNQIAPEPTGNADTAAEPSSTAAAAGDDGQVVARGVDINAPSRTSSGYLQTSGEDGGEVWVRQAAKPKKKSWVGQQHWKIRMLAKSEQLGNIVLVFICLNTLQMLIDINCDHCDYDYQKGVVGAIDCPGFKASLEFFNFVFSFIFLLEMLIKQIGLGLPKYFASKANIFDFVIVTISIFEIFGGGGIETVQCYLVKRPKNQCHEYYTVCEGGVGGASVFRAFRMVRIVKLLRALPGVQAQVQVLSETAAAVGWLLVLILLFLFIFLVLGMNLFGGTLMAEWDAESVALGAAVFVEFPASEGLRYGRVVGMDHFNHTTTPWFVQILYTDGNAPGIVALRDELSLLPQEKSGDWAVWASTADDTDVGIPKIVGFPPRFNFDSFRLSMFTAVQLITAEGWNDNLYDIVGSTDVWSGLYLFALIICGTWILFGLFVGILISNMNQKRELELANNMQLMRERLLAQFGDLTDNDLGKRVEAIFMSIDKDGSGQIDTYEFGDALQQLNISLRPKELIEVVAKYDVDGSGAIDFDEFLNMIQSLLKEARELEGIEDDDTDPFASLHELHREEGKPNLINPDGSLADGEEKTEEELAAAEEERLRLEMSDRSDRKNRSCCCLWRDNSFRQMCYVFAFNPKFEAYILVCIGISTICLAIDMPAWGETTDASQYPTSPMRRALEVIDYILNVSFLVECVSKVIALSFREYIKSGWNKLDFLIVFTSTIDMLLTLIMAALAGGADVDLSPLRIFRIFRIFRALRPLRIIAKAKGLQVLVKTFISALGPACNTFGIALGVFVIMGCVGMQLFAAKLYRCSDPTVQLRFPGEVTSIHGESLNTWDPGCVGIDIEGNMREWTDYDLSFDDVFRSVRFMFLLMTQDNWPGHFLTLIDARSKFEIPVIDFNWMSWLFAFVFVFASIIICGSVVINMVIGVFVDCYNSNVASTGRADPPPLKAILKPVWEDPEEGLQGIVFNLVKHQKFDLVIAFFIVTNIIAMAVESWKPSSGQVQFDVVTNYFFTYVFGVECFLKMWTLRQKRYFHNGWNKFDFFIVTVSYLGIAIDNMGSMLDPTIVRILRMFRVFRILRAFRVFKALKSLQNLVSTIAKALPSMGNLVCFLLLFFFIWSVLGVVLYGNMCMEDDVNPEEVGPVWGVESALVKPSLRMTRCLFTEPDALLSKQAHFQNVAWTLLTLFRISTGDAWGDVMTSLQLASGDRAAPISDDVWVYYGALLEQDVADVQADMNVLSKDETNNLFLKQPENGRIRLKMAEKALSKWNASADDDIKESWAAGARLVLPGCLLGDEALFLQSKALMDCSVEYNNKLYSAECTSTCGGMNVPLVANLYLIAFVVMSAIILLQLVLAVLMDALSQSEGEATHTMPHCEELTKTQFMRIRRRWRRKAEFRLKSQGLWVDGDPTAGLGKRSPMVLRGRSGSPQLPQPVDGWQATGGAASTEAALPPLPEDLTQTGIQPFQQAQDITPPPA